MDIAETLLPFPAASINGLLEPVSAELRFFFSPAEFISPRAKPSPGVAQALCIEALCIEVLRIEVLRIELAHL